MNDHSDIIALWASLADFAADIGVSTNTAKQMRTRKRIGAAHWPKVQEAAERRGIKGGNEEEITAALLSNLSSQEPAQDAAE